MSRPILRDEDSRTLYRLALEYFGYRVVEAVDGADGVQAAEVLDHVRRLVGAPDD